VIYIVDDFIILAIFMHNDLMEAMFTMTRIDTATLKEFTNKCKRDGYVQTVKYMWRRFPNLNGISTINNKHLIDITI
jgi:hypothetical protein